MNTAISIVTPVFLIVALGYICARKNLFDKEAQAAFGRFVYYCSMPALLLLTMAKAKAETAFRIDFIGAFAISLVLTGIAGFFVTRRLARYDFTASVLGMMSACHNNAAFIGIPLIVMAYGDPAPAVMALLFQIVFVIPAILASIDIHRKHGAISAKALQEIPKAMLLNPIVGAVLLGLLLLWQGWKLPAPIEHSVQLLGQACIPTALFALGLSLGTIRQKEPHSKKWLVWTLVGLKSLLQPAIAWLVGRYVFNLPDMWLGALTIMAAMPTAMNNFIFSQRYRTFEEESGQVVFFSTVVSLFTLAALLALFQVGR